MKDGIQRKFALLINDDPGVFNPKEPEGLRHPHNMEDSAQAFHDAGFDEIIALNPKGLQGPVTIFYKPTLPNLDRVLEHIRAQSDDDDVISVYVTGHGAEGKDGEGALLVGGHEIPYRELAAKLDQIRYGKRFVFLDPCNAGGSLLPFANERTQVITLGSRGQTVFCSTFSPHFWKSKADFDGDGISTIEERFQDALEKGQPPTLPQVYIPEGGSFSLDGLDDKSPAFKPEVVTVHDGSQLKTLLKTLKPTEMALVTFSADWCGVCRKYAPRFEELAAQGKGRFLMIRAEGINQSERNWEEFVKTPTLPQMAFINGMGKVTQIPATPEARDNPLAFLRLTSVYTDRERQGYYEKRLPEYEALLWSPDPNDIFRGIYSLGQSGHPKALPLLLPFLKSSREWEVEEALKAIGNLGKAGASAFFIVASLTDDFRAKVWMQALATVGQIGAGSNQKLVALLKKIYGGNNHVKAYLAYEALAKLQGKSGKEIVNELVAELVRGYYQDERQRYKNALHTLTHLDKWPGVPEEMHRVLKEGSKEEVFVVTVAAQYMGSSMVNLCATLLQNTYSSDNQLKTMSLVAYFSSIHKVESEHLQEIHDLMLRALDDSEDYLKIQALGCFSYLLQDADPDTFTAEGLDLLDAVVARIRSDSNPQVRDWDKNGENGLEQQLQKLRKTKESK